MRRYLLALAAFAASAFVTTISAEEQSTTIDFSGCNQTYISSSNVKSILGNDWGYAGTYNYCFRVQPQIGPDGSDALKGCTSETNGVNGALVYYAKGPGKITFDVIGYGNQSEAYNFIEFFSASYNGSEYSLGQSIKKFSGISSSEWSKRELEIPSTGWIAFKAALVYIDNFTNIWEAGVAAETYTLTGIVTDSETSEPVADAKVSIVGGNNTTTGQDGAFTIEGLTDGEYIVNVSAAGYVASQKTLTVEGSDVGNFKIELTTQKSTLSGLVMSALADASPVNGAELQLYLPESEDPVATATTGDDGSYSLTLSGVLNPEGYTLSISAPYYQSLTRHISVGGVAPCFRRGETVSSSLYLNPKYVGFYANVMDADSVGIATATVLLRPEGAEEPLRAVNYGGGRYGVGNLSAANIAKSYTFSVSAPYYEGFTSESFSFDGKDYNTDVILASKSCTFTATVTSRFGSAIDGAAVTIDGKECEADANGSFIWTVSAADAADDTFAAVATAPGYDAQTFEFSFVETNAVSHNFMLSESKYTLLVAVTDKADGAALADATVTVTDADGAQLNVTALGDGTFSATVTALVAAKTTYSVTASCEGFITSAPTTVSLAEGSAEITIALEPDPAGLDSIGAEAKGGAAIFDLQGRRVAKVAKGTVTITNGKKTINL